jgi:hypothetical protein
MEHVKHKRTMQQSSRLRMQPVSIKVFKECLLWHTYKTITHTYIPNLGLYMFFPEKQKGNKQPKEVSKRQQNVLRRMQFKWHTMLACGWYHRQLSLGRLAACVVATFSMSIYIDKHKLFIGLYVEINVVLNKLTFLLCDKQGYMFVQILWQDVRKGIVKWNFKHQKFTLISFTGATG